MKPMHGVNGFVPKEITRSRGRMEDLQEKLTAYTQQLEQVYMKL